ncbi:RNA methyltransferase [Sideroxydans lithotrophicus]|uniref:Radical SAM domain protein n=1 Tax=Sideroxydans lithotrophicus (strain ES-1) TaxID=580332 RepID=D5CUP0_SIDLE|nr:RNA methyltransferase [Sideroxydans lithotrophicus]ADE12427.1 Radical SAM domain protein [Sideroxydans lithotrophicus ES-1]
MRISHLRQRLYDLGAKPCHEDRLLRGWSQVCSYDRKGSPAETFFPLALRNELPGIEAELDGLARLKSEHPDTLTLPLSQGERELNRHSDNEKVARLLIELHDGQMVESVLLPRGGLCVSTQVGCAVGCVFCMSGRDGLLRQLGSAEIVAQVVLARKRRAVSKVVFMGMGEPAHNLDNVLEAIELLGTQGNIGHKNLVLSTVGDLRVFERLMEGLTHKPSPQPSGGTTDHSTRPSENNGQVAGHPACGRGGNRERQSSIAAVKPALALSLHTTDEVLRTRLLPQAPRIPVEELVERAEIYARATGYPVQYQWTLIEGVNDSDAELARIVQLLKGKYAIMNFIPFNEVDGLTYRRPSGERIAAMAYALNGQGIYSRVRDSAGQEIEGACGQLRARAAKTRESASNIRGQILQRA